MFLPPLSNYIIVRTKEVNGMAQTLEQKIRAAREMMPKLHLEGHDVYGYADTVFNQHLLDLSSLQTARYDVIAALHRKSINTATSAGTRHEERMLLSVAYRATGEETARSLRDEQPAGGYYTDVYDLYYQEHPLPSTVGTAYTDLSLEAVNDTTVRVRWSVPEHPGFVRVYDIDLARAETLLSCLNLEESKAPRRVFRRWKTER